MSTSPYSEEFLQLLLTNKRIIYKICHAYCNNRNDHDDLAQEIAYQLWKSKDNFNPDYVFTTWMYRIALNVAISFYRKEKKSPVKTVISDHLLEIEEDRDDAHEKDSRINRLQQIINELKELERALMILYLEEKSYKEIAEILGITETNVATRISRVKAQLKQKLSI
jgi:RNA polymerase sigma factor (sigma-70 family)